MHAVVTHARIADRERAEQFLREQVIPGVSGAPGFVTGHWVNVGGDRGVSISVFESEDAAKQVVDRVQTPPGDVVTIESQEVGEVVGNA
jgi:heme-degrading monooxygenase HmoA